ncbi:S-layer homology domain-containing protein [Ureibacillus composti]
MGKLIKVTKTLAAMGLAGTLLLTTNGVTSAQVHYKDVNKTDNFYDSVDYLLTKKAISRSLPNFRPYENITRGQFASIITKVVEYRFKEVEYSQWWNGSNFIDVPKTHQFYSYVEKLDYNNIMSGYYPIRWDYSTRAFGVNDSLTRGQLAGVLVKVYSIPLITDESYKANGGKKSDIFDGERFTNQWGQAIATLETIGIMSGYGDGTFKPNKPINRSQFANMLYKKETGQKVVYKQSPILEQFEALGITKEAAIKTIKSLKNNSVMNYVATYTDYYDDALTFYYTDYFVLEIRKEGEIIFDEINTKLVVSKDATSEDWKINVQPIIEE